MRSKQKESSGARSLRQRENWNDWYAWRPVRTYNFPGTTEEKCFWVWRETIERKYCLHYDGGGEWVYRVKK